MIYESESGNIKMAITGDTLIGTNMSVYREQNFLKMVDLIRNADFAFTNNEMPFNRYEDPPSYKTSGGGNLCSPPNLLDEIRWLGVDVLAVANNHSYDFGENGILTNMNYMDLSGIPYAGIGRNLAEARAPVYIDTPKGRVALISATSSGPQYMIAADQWRDGMGRPGANMIRSITQHVVDKVTFDAIRRWRNKMLGADLDPSTQSMLGRKRPSLGEETILEDNDQQFFLPDLHPASQYPNPSGVMIVLGNEFRTHLFPYVDDIANNIQRIKEASAMADWVVVTMHDHDDGKTANDPSDIAVIFGKAAIDAGAHVFAVHGPHRDRGIEIYKGRPIFYSLAHLVFQHELAAKMPFENMLRVGLGWESTTADFLDQTGKGALGGFTEPFRWRNAFATVEFQKGSLVEVRLHPLDLGHGLPRSQRGRPMLAEGEVAQEILQMFIRLSSPLGTTIDIEGDTGVIKNQQDSH